MLKNLCKDPQGKMADLMLPSQRCCRNKFFDCICSAVAGFAHVSSMPLVLKSLNSGEAVLLAVCNVFSNFSKHSTQAQMQTEVQGSAFCRLLGVQD